MLLKIYRFRVYSEFEEYYIQYACRKLSLASERAVDYALQNSLLLDNPVLVGYLPVDSSFVMPKSPVLICPKEN